MMANNQSKPYKRVFVSGNFFVLHPGHLRLLKFAAECGDKLFVGVNNTRPNNDYPSVEERAETLRELGLVHKVVILNDGLEKYLSNLKPDLVVKGKEYEGKKNQEELWLKKWGGRILFTAGDVAYSGSELLRDSYFDRAQIWLQPKDYIERHECTREYLLPIIEKFKTLNVAVIGDLIVDEYIQCEALGMSREDPTLVISPQESIKYLGGAGIVSAHCSGLGANVSFFSIMGGDELSTWAKDKLGVSGVISNLYIDQSRPTTLKQRYRVGQKTMMRVSHLRQHEISKQLQENIFKEIEKRIEEIDCLIFSDFSYGALPQLLVARIIELGLKNDVYMAADSQTSSQMGDINRFCRVNLVTPTEHEARISLRDQTSGLHIIAKKLIKRCKAEQAIVTLGEAGSLIVTSNLEVDRLPALNTAPVDISGAGDSMLVATTLARALGVDPFRAAYFGAIAAAIQVGRLGNIPLQVDELRGALI